MSNKLTQMARELLCIEADLPSRLNYDRKPRPTLEEFSVYSFEQTWPSTALGFTGIGGQQITGAQTYVLIPESCEERCFVYFGGRFAYAVPYSDEFMKDVYMMKMQPVSRHGKYMKG